MKTKILLLAAVLLMSVSCSFGTSKDVIGGAVKTVNGGADWQFANTISGSKATLASLNVSKIAFDPSNRQEVYVGGYNGGLYKWDDGSSSWKEILSNILVYDFAVNPLDSKVIYVAGLFGDHGRVLITKDGGATWTQIFNDPATSNPVRAVVLNPGSPSQVMIGLGSGSIIKSNDGGLSWQLVKDFTDRVNRMAWQNGSVYVLLQVKGLFASSDFGTNFSQLSATLAPASSTGNNPFNSSNSAINYNQFFVDPVSSGLMYVTTSQGLYKTLDGGKTWSLVTLPVQNGQSLTRAIAVANSSSNLVFTSIGSTIYKSTDAGQTWQTQKVATNGLINYIIVDPTLPQIAWAGVYGQ